MSWAAVAVAGAGLASTIISSSSQGKGGGGGAGGGQGKGGGGGGGQAPVVPINIAPSTDVPLINFEELLAGNAPFSNSSGFRIATGSPGPSLPSQGGEGDGGADIFSALGNAFAEGAFGKGGKGGGGGSSAGIQSINSLGPSLTAGG